MNEAKLQEAIANPSNLGEMEDADAMGTVGSPECGDMIRMWLKFSEKDGRKVIDRASFQSFGCQTAIAVASVATEMLKGKTIEDAMAMTAEDMSQPLGALPPMKIHCGQMVEGALRAALEQDAAGRGMEAASPMSEPVTIPGAPMLAESLQVSKTAAGKIKIVFEQPESEA
ncbi:MAG: iron-sulfur cluster assembly scaffold protein [Verrucomicrobia bacterium]|nr:iron-sulfur cluster assembly scaffold protein [Verrucomicrobiota bacterium]